MNKSRIQQLKVQACKWAAENTCSKQYENACDEKFAELIVRECLTFVEPMPGSGDIDDLELEAAYNQIKEHFGVEE